MEISQLRIGLPQEIETKSGTIVTAIMKSEVSGPVMVTDKGLEGDGWGNPKVHGTPQQIICAYPQEHYAYWKSLMPIDFGSFGENMLSTPFHPISEPFNGDLKRLTQKANS
jgi:MOSC domain-containing protein YiiM